MVDVRKYSDSNFYELLNIEIDANDNDIRKAYRKKALECHPDKNPDPKAAELFHELSKALEILSDASARLAYDRILNAKKAAELRNKQLDSKRQKLKSDLEERERLANIRSSKNSSYSTERTPEEILQCEIERLRKEGSRLLEEQMEIMQKQLHEERDKILNSASIIKTNQANHRLKIKWSAEKNDPTNGGYNEELLRKFFQKYDEIVALVMSKKNGSALIEFRTEDGAEMAVSYEKGLLKNPLRIEWVSTDPTSKCKLKYKNKNSTITDHDFESLVLREMRQAEERKKLIEQLMKDDDNDKS